MGNHHGAYNVSESSDPLLVSAQSLRRGDLTVDFTQHVITLAGKTLDLSSTEFELLAQLARAAPQVISPQELASHAQGYAVESLQEANATLRYHFYRLRRKIKEATGRDDVIKTIYGVGYALYQRPESDLPYGAITFLLTDIEDSTTLWENYPIEMKAALARHDELLRQVIETQGGYIFKRAGDMFGAAFTSPYAGLTTALAIQRALYAEAWALPARLRVRVALHTGPAESRDGDYFGVTVNSLARMIAVGHGGQVLLSQSTQEQVVGHLPPGVELRDLGLRRLKGVKELTRLFQLSVSDLPAQFPPLRTSDAPPTNLPGQLTSFIGREWDMRQVAALLRRPDVRLLTLTGAGGAGKTRFGLQLAASLLDEFQDGVFLIPLATIRQSELVTPAIARALGLGEQANKPILERLGEHLRERQMLLLLDNFEQVLDAAPIVTDLLRLAPHVKVLATSRETLHVYGEHQYPIAALTMPDLHERITLAQLERYEATKLFVARARAMDPRREFLEADAPVIAEISVCLDGLPLAIELAASCIPDLSLTELAGQLTNRLGLLSTGPRDVPARHRTLRGLLDWSFHLLNANEQALFARLSVFVGGWAVEAAQAVATWSGDEHPFEPYSLDALVAKNLIQPAQGPPEQPRLTMLETIREYAQEQLEASGDLETVRGLHAAYCAEALERAESDLIGGARQKHVVWMCEVEQDNFRAALQWAMDHDRLDLALRMVKPLWRYWSISSQLHEGRRWTEQVLALGENVGPPLRAAALYGLGKLAMFQTDYAAAQRAAESALALYRDLDDQDGIAWCMNALGEIAFNQDDPSRAMSYVEPALALHKQVNDKLGIAKGLDDLGRLAMAKGDYPRALELLEAGLKLRRERASPEGIAVGLLALGEVLRLQGDYQKAEMRTRESLARYRQLNHAAGIITCLDNLAGMRRAQNDPAQAIALYLEELGLLRDLEEDERELVLACLVGLTEALYATEEHYKAAQVIGAYERLEPAEPSPRSGDVIQASTRASLRRMLGDARWARATTEGRSMNADDLLLALSKRAN